ncbi:hypothetical protein [Spirosoma montaniterrae]|uniref:Uncharacterized protein n=1 Tax=Spirosoma montaniterrae TaxID=1178516 RepID=A0A1P9X231_9BACT|nr:hypothetical protein [Spirosoma montaniterrae]AQG81690.1 hypothetical protein AWR27_21725 [Spirosoma montaniterrae]
MKTLLIVGIVLLGVSGQAIGMGHPHNLFAARKQMRAKASAAVRKTRVQSPGVSCWQPAVDKAAFSKRLLSALSQMRPSQAF